MKDRPSWYVDINNVRTDYIVLENLKQFLVGDVPYLHPANPEYALFWSKQIKKCIEGMWGKEFGKWRFMPGKLYFFGNFGILENTIQTDDGGEITKTVKPSIVDYVWDFAYSSLVCYGFSGFVGDNKYSCNKNILLYKQGIVKKEELSKFCINSKGEVKEYIEPYEYASKLHNSNLGRVLYENEKENFINLGSRGGGKSYWVAVAELEYNYIFGGATSYKDFLHRMPKSDQCVGSADSDKSSDLLSKFKVSLDAKMDTSNPDYIKWFGIYTETKISANGRRKEKITPSPLYIRSLGNLDCPNKKTNKIYRSRYKVKVNGEWKERGRRSTVAHVNYSSKKGTGSQAAAGGRYLFSDLEEVGLAENSVDILGSNEGATARNGRRTGVNWGQGTSGNIDYIQGTKSIFLDPKSYGMISYKNQNGDEGKDGYIGYFLPYYITIFRYKDENGNTDFSRVIDEVNRQRQEKANSSDPRVLREFIMNKPCYTHEMWTTNQGYYLPYDEAVVRKRELTAGNLYEDLMTNVKLKWDNNESSGVGYEILHNAVPHTKFPIPKDMKDPSGNVVIYEFPEENAPEDLYCFIGHDPYVEEDINKGGSLGVTYVLKNPRYVTQGISGNIIVASYIGKPVAGLDYYHSQQEKLIALYGNPQRGLWYEKNRGEMCRSYYIRKNKVNLLCLAPQFMSGTTNKERKIHDLGFYVGANGSLGKKNLLKLTRDWLLEPTTFLNTLTGKEQTLLNIQRIPCLFFIEQISQFDLDGNFDAISGFIGCVLGLREYEARFDAQMIKSNNKKRESIYSRFTTNASIFNADYIKRYN